MGKLGAIFAFLLAAFGSLSAHELGGASVRVTVQANRMAQVRVAVDPEHLPLALNPYLGMSDEAIDTSEGARRAEVFMRTYMAHLHLAFRGTVFTPEARLEPRVTWAASPRFAFQFSLPLPLSAEVLTWRQDLALGQYFFVMANEKGEELKLWMEGGKGREVPLKEVVPNVGRLGQILSYLRLGFTHILPEGLDHILFVLGIFLLTLDWRSLLWQVTAFTVAHSITLGLSLYGVISLSPAIVEPLIALSLVAVAVENVWARAFHWRRVALVFAFGLLHGLGFAGALQDLGLPRGEFLLALIGFNGGVELGQLSVVALAYLTLGLPFGLKAWYRPRLTVPASLLIGGIGLVWTWQRVF